jgi:two-component system CheB/CheR fusion protein
VGKKTPKRKAGANPEKTGEKHTSRTRRSDAATPPPTSERLTIVGIGASAGGLEAFTELLHGLPTDTGMAFMFVQHFKPDRHTMLPEILSRETTMPVREITDGTRLEPDHVYVMSAYTSVAFVEDTVFISRDTDTVEHLPMPIDHFLQSLAEYRDGQAIGVILSGTASDGTQGLLAIKAAGGVTIVQSEDSARYDSMPHSAIAAGAADLVLGPRQIGEELKVLARHPQLKRPGGQELESEPSLFSEICGLIKGRTGIDFSGYKYNTIARRTKRRMLVHRLSSTTAYLNFLRTHRDEVEALTQDMLINVTGFFRDPEVYELLKKTVFPGLIKDRSPDSPLRIWVPGCSSGEEVYSIIMALQEYLDQQALSFPLQIFGTDVDARAIDKARSGLYTESVTQDLSESRLRRFFTATPQGYQISKSLRDLCVFAVHNVVQDPPFSRLDLISCRNLLIYLGAGLQQKILPLFHFALRRDGFLLLGTAETVGTSGDLFSLVDKKFKLYRKRNIQTPPPVLFTAPPLPHPHRMPESDSTLSAMAPLHGIDVRRHSDQLLLRKYTPAAVLVNDSLDIVQFRGHTGPFLEPAPGAARLNLLAMVREGLVPQLRTALDEARQQNTPVRKEGLRCNFEDHIRDINIEVEPLGEPPGQYFLVVFERAPETMATVGTSGDESPEVAALQHELHSTKEYLQTVVEQYEATNEELRCASEEVQSGYEELQSTNEELQSSNEELETAKEELQSTNEELRTVNDELSNRNLALSRVNDDLHNLMSSVDLAVVIVGTDLRIRRFTPRAAQLLNLIDADIERPITHIRPRVALPPLEPLVDRVLKTVRVSTQDIQDADGHWYSLRIHPYRTLDNRIDGAVIAMVDVDQVKRALELAEAARDYAEQVVAAVRHPMLVLDRNLQVTSASAAYLHTFGVTEKETTGNLVYRLGKAQWAIPELRARLEAALAEKKAFDDFVVEHDFPKLGRRVMAVSARPIDARVDGAPLVLMQIEDVTDRTPISAQPEQQ